MASANFTQIREQNWNQKFRLPISPKKPMWSVGLSSSIMNRITEETKCTPFCAKQDMAVPEGYS